MAMTDQEKAVIEALSSAWNLYVELPIEHPDDQDEFRHALHAAGAKVFMRSGRREFRGE